MKFFEMLAEFFGSPVESITAWLDELQIALGDWFSELMANVGIGITSFCIEGVAVFVIGYGVYCACRIMCSNKDETFSEYLNKSLIAAIGYFFVKCGGNIILHYLGV